MRIHGRAVGGGAHPLHGKNERQHAQNEDADEEERVGESERCGLPDELAEHHPVRRPSHVFLNKKNKNIVAIGPKR